MRRRRLVQLASVSGLAAVAGCLDILAGDQAEPTPPPDEPTPTPVEEDPTPTPEGVDALAGLVDAFDARPFNDAQLEIEGANRAYTPRHVWQFVSDESLIGLHFDEPNPEQATALDYIVIGRKGLFTEESRPDAEFSHFHQVDADSWEGGHGGGEGDEGYWLTHIAVRDIQYPFHDEEIGPRVDYEFMPTLPPEGSTGHHTEFTSPGGDEGPLDPGVRDAVLEVFDGQPFNEAQQEIDGDDRTYTPRHVWFGASPGVYVFLHFDEPNPEAATNLDYFGIGVSGRFTVEDIPAGQVEDLPTSTSSRPTAGRRATGERTSRTKGCGWSITPSGRSNIPSTRNRYPWASIASSCRHRPPTADGPRPPGSATAVDRSDGVRGHAGRLHRSASGGRRR